MMMMNLILASGSPRRKELLSLYTTDFTICVSDFDENGVTAPTPAQLVEKLARGKCLAVAARRPLARPAGRGLLHHHGPARQPDGPSAEQILMRDAEKRPRRPKMKKLEKVYGNA